MAIVNKPCIKGTYTAREVAPEKQALHHHKQMYTNKMERRVHTQAEEGNGGEMLV